MNILSCFDGISGAQLALQRAGIKVDNYFASEIDKYAVKITQKNFPNTLQLGDITQWKDWKLPKIDLLIGGSPCQGFSIAGKGLNFDDPRSKLFFEFVDILKYYKPKFFLLENVKMKKEWADIITENMEVEPIEINSSLVSAQNRKRLYWTNIPNVSQPEDREILLADIIDNNTNPVLLHNLYGGFGETKPRVFTEKSPTLRTPKGGGHIPSIVVGNVYPNKGQNGNVYSIDGKAPALRSGQGIVGKGIGSSNSPKVTLSKKELEYMNRNTIDGRTHWDFNHHSDTSEQKSSAIVSNYYKGVPYNVLIDKTGSDICYRKLTPIECERLQTFPDNYTEGVSNTQRYKALGNSFTVDVIAHILLYMKG